MAQEKALQNKAAQEKVLQKKPAQERPLQKKVAQEELFKKVAQESHSREIGLSLVAMMTIDCFPLHPSVKAI